MAGKALEDVTSLCKCPVCGGVKKMHHLCEHCMGSKCHRVSPMWLGSVLTQITEMKKMMDEKVRAKTAEMTLKKE